VFKKEKLAVGCQGILVVVQIKKKRQRQEEAGLLLCKNFY
jgi:hypothetical protein